MYVDIINKRKRISKRVSWDEMSVGYWRKGVSVVFVQSWNDFKLCKTIYKLLVYKWAKILLIEIWSF